MIQIITYNVRKYEEYSDTTYKVSRLGDIQALDDFDICIVDLSDEDLWKYDQSEPININSYKDLLTIKEAIINKNKSKILIVLPQNKKFYYYGVQKYINSHYQTILDKFIQLKDNKENLVKIINNNLWDIGKVKLSFEKTKTVVENNKIDADFNFTNYEESGFEKVTYSKSSDKVTTIRKDTIFLTTLNLLEDGELLKVFIDTYFKEKMQKENTPDWVKDIKFFNDEQLIKDREKNLIKIEELEIKNNGIDQQLNKNLKYKSILYTNGDELVKVVLQILDEMLEYDSSGFIDENKEDFLIKKEDVTFVGEIKGVSSSVENKNVSQLDVHVQSYLDKLQEEGKEENVKGLLIINHQRNKPLNERQTVHEHQQKLAIRNNALIIETITLLRVYEEYKFGKLTPEECKKMFMDNIGLLKI